MGKLGSRGLRGRRVIGCEATRVPYHARDDYVFNLGVEVVRRGAIDLLSFFDFPAVFLYDTSPPLNRSRTPPPVGSGL